MSKRKKLTIIILSIVCFFVVAISVSAAIIASLSVRGEITTTSTTISAAATYTSEASDYKLEFSAPGDEKHIDTSVINNTTTDSLHVYHEISLTGSDSDLADAILVYYNGKFVNTLSSIITNHTQINDEYALIAPGKTVNGRISFELHNSAPNGLFDGKTFGITITTYAENMDYGKYILVTNEAEFNNAIDDINSGYFDELPTIVLQNAITLSNAVTIKNPTKIHLNSYALTGSITVNDDNTTNPDALLEVLGTGSITSATVGANYNVAGAKALVKNYIESQVKDGISATDTINILGPYGFYGFNIVTDNVTTYTAPNLTGNVHYTTESKITIGSTEYAYVKALGTDLALVSNYLNHLPQANEIISSNLFLPTAIPGQNATIEWKSSNTSIMSDKGKIVANGRVDASDGDVELIATIKVNDTTYTERYAFRVSSHSNEVNFQKLVQDMSPLIITLVDDGTENTKYYLPKVGTYDSGTGHFSQYDYRTTFTTPSVDPTVTWNAHQNIDLTSLTYSMTPAQAAEYDYITIDSTTNNKVYLSKNTLSNYAKITVTGRFSNGEEYSSILNISIALGSDTQLLEKAFSSIDQTIGNISILGNMLKTRSTAGIIGEKGDFILPSKFGTDYTISYTCDSDIISSIEPVIEDGETTGYKFIVDPIKFKSTETSVPIYVTVTYLRPEGNITKQKAIYIDAPAAIHTKDVGTISIFNTLKYQTFQALGETTNNGFTTSTPLVTDNGYDYLLIRDMIGDANYLTDYRVSDLYLTMNNITSSNYAPGLATLKLYVNSTNNTSTTDTAAYDFVKLLQWATGNTKVTAGSVVSADGNTTLGALANNKSNGETYLSTKELSVIEAYYKAKTNDTNGAKWDALTAIAMETAPGYVYDSATLIETVLNCLVSEIGSSTWWENYALSTYGKIYAKYLEIVNRYAITTSSNEEQMSPAQEVYNSKFTYNISQTQTYPTAGTTNASIPAKILVDGVYVDGYWNRSNETNWHSYGSGSNQGTYAQPAYYSDKTKYITEPELTVLKAFWLGAMSKRTTNNNPNTDDAATENVLKQFNATSISKITQALAPVDGELPYPGFEITDFTYYGQAIINAFNACLVVPTYLSSNGINLLVESFYENFNTTGYHYKEYGSNTPSPFTSVLVNSVPAVTNLDNLEGGLSFFKGLTTIDIKGNTALHAFLGDYGLSQTFARMGLTNVNTTSLTMQYVSPKWNTFDITNVRHFATLQSFDISNNLGIKSVTPLLNTKRGGYTNINFSNIGEVFEYNEFVIDNLAYSCNVTYSNASDVVTTKNKISGTESILINLSDINDFVSEHIYLTNVIYDDSGTAKNVTWRIEQGNTINEDEITTGGDLETIDTVRDMNLRISPYYYCHTGFTYDGYTFTQGNVYKITVESGIAQVVQVNVANGHTFNVEYVDDIPATDLNQIALLPDDAEGMTVYNPAKTHDGESSHNTVQSGVNTGTIYQQDTAILGSTSTYRIYMYYHVFSFQALNENDNYAQTYYIRSNGNELTANTNSLSLDCYMVVLSQTEAQFVDFLNHNNNTISSAKLSEYGVTVSGSNIYLGVQTLLSSSSTEYYIYNTGSKMFMCEAGFKEELGDLFTITYSSSNYHIRNVTAQKNLTAFKVHVSSNNVHIVIISAIFYNTTAQDNISSFGNGARKEYNYNLAHNTNGTASTFGTSSQAWNISVISNTPSITITTAEGLTYTATFTCYTIRNSRQVNGITYTNTNTGTIGSKGYVYDNGATLLLNIVDTQPVGYEYYFALLTNADITRLNNWYANPTSNITIGNTVSGAAGSRYDYYIYNPFTRRYATGTNTNQTGYVYYTTITKPSSTFRLTYGSSTVDGNGVGYSISYSTRVGTLNQGVFSNNGISWNAYGGISKACYAIAGWTTDSGSIWVFDEVQESNQYVDAYHEPAVTQNFLSYQLDYSVNRVQAHILRSNIEKEYEFDKFYYLSEDTVIDGVTYKAGNVIKFVYKAYYGFEYEADIEYYETIFTYYDSDSVAHVLPKCMSVEYEFYPTQGNGLTSEITYTKIVDPDNYFSNYDASFTYENDTGTHTVTYPNNTRWIFTSEGFNEIKGSLYQDEYGTPVPANATFDASNRYYYADYKEEDIFDYEFNLAKDHLYEPTTANIQTVDITLNGSSTGFKPNGTSGGKVTVTNYNYQPQNNILTVYFERPDWWTGANIHAYVWNNTTGTYKVALPGEKVTYMGLDAYGKDYYSYQVDLTQFDRIIFNDSVNQAQYGNAYETQTQVLTATTTGFKPNGQDGSEKVICQAMSFIDFENTNNWVSVYAYIWNNSSQTAKYPWPGIKLSAIGTDTLGYDGYQLEVNLSEYDRVIFNNGTSNMASPSYSHFDRTKAYYEKGYSVINGINSSNFELYKSTLYYDTDGTPVPITDAYDSGKTYYVVDNYYVTTVTEDNFEIIRDQLFIDNLGTRVGNAAYSSSQTYYMRGQGGYYAATVNAGNFESLKAKLYLDNRGTKVSASATFDPDQVYYLRSFVQAVGLNSTNYPMVVHHLYNTSTGGDVLEDESYNMDIQYYQDDYVVSTFAADTFNQYRTRLYLDNKGTAIDLEASFIPTKQYYMNVYEVARDINSTNFNTYKDYLYSNAYGEPLEAGAIFDSNMVYYKKKHTLAMPSPQGDTESKWNEQAKNIIRLYSHTKLATSNNLDDYKVDYTHVYDGVSGYPTIYKYTGTGAENIYSNPTVTATVTTVDDVQVVTFTATENLTNRNVSYVTNAGYYFTEDASHILGWGTLNEQNLSNTAETMDQIIINANASFNTRDYSLWYGKHYAYNGFTMQSDYVKGKNGYDKGYVYRIVVNDAKTGFIWERVYQYFRKEGPLMVEESSTGAAHENDVVFATTTCFNSFYTGGKFYRIIRDDFTKTLNVIQFTDVTLTYNNLITDIHSEKIRYIHQSDYLGYAGTYELIISAVIRDPNGDGNYSDEEVKTYKIKFVGTVIR